MATGIEGAARGAGPGAERRPVIDRIAHASPATLLLAAAAAASAALLLALGAKLTFLLDDWTFLVYRDGFSVDSILLPHNENIAILPVLAYKALLATVGMESALPYRVVATAVFILSAVLLFAWLRPRIGEWLALAAAVLILFLGSAWEDLLWPFQLGYFGSMAAGLGMLLALDRGDRVGDRLAAVLLTISLAFSSIGLPFAAGAAAAVLVGPRTTWRSRGFVVVVPMALFALWWLGWGREAENSITLENVATAPVFMAEGIAASLSSLLGLATPRDEAGIGPLDWGMPLLVVGLALAAWRLWRLRRVPPTLIVVVAIAAAFWLLAGINEKEGRLPTASRYMYPGAIFVLLIAGELLRGVRFSRLALAGAFAVTALAVASNVEYLYASYKSYRSTSEIERADLAAVEIARDTVEPGFVLRNRIARTPYVHIEAGPYLSAVDKYGSPAYTEAELAEAPEHAREPADVVLANALGVSFSIRDDGPPPQRESCIAAAGGELIDLPPGGAVIVAPPRSAATVRMRRFAVESSPVLVGDVPAGRSAVLSIPTDRSQRPWRLELETRGEALVCGRRG